MHSARRCSRNSYQADKNQIRTLTGSASAPPASAWASLPPLFEAQEQASTASCCSSATSSSAAKPDDFTFLPLSLSLFDVVSGGGEYKRKRLRIRQLSRQAGGQEEPARLNHVRGVRRRVVIVVVVVARFEVREELPELERVHVRERVQQTVPVHHGPYRPRQNTRRSAAAAVTSFDDELMTTGPTQK